MIGPPPHILFKPMNDYREYIKKHPTGGGKPDNNGCFGIFLVLCIIITLIIIH